MPTMNLRTATLIIGGITVEIGEGNLTYSEKRALEYVTNRNDISDVRLADEEPLELKMDFTWKRVAGDFAALIEKIKGTGTSVTSDPVACRPYAVNVVLQYPDSCGPTPTSKDIEFDNFRYDQLDYDVGAGTISCAGKCNITYPAIT